MSGETLKLREASVMHADALRAWEQAMDIRRGTSVEVRRTARRALDDATRCLEIAAEDFARYMCERRERSQPLPPVDWVGQFRDHEARGAEYKREAIGEYQPAPDALEIPSGAVLCDPAPTSGGHSYSLRRPFAETVRVGKRR